MQATLHIQAERRRVEAVVETLATATRRGDSRAALSHDARNMVTALSLYCDLLEQPGVLAEGHQHCAQELRLVADASRRLVEKLMTFEGSSTYEAFARPAENFLATVPCSSELSIANLAEELEANRNLLDAIAGLGVAVALRIRGGRVPVLMHGEDLTRILVNLVKNAAEAMQGTGTITFELTERAASNKARSVKAGKNKRAGNKPGTILLTVQDSGPGIPNSLREKVFENGYTTHPLATSGWVGPHRGLGLAICRSLVESAGGRMSVSSPKGGGARFEIEIPVKA